MTQQITRQKTGLVISSSRDKTITVLIERKVKHALYKKILRRSTKLQAHDEGNECADGDVVIIDSKKADIRLVKRIVGIPGDTIYMQNNGLVINGTATDYHVLSRSDDALIILEDLPGKTHQARVSRHFIRRSSRNYGPTIVPQDQYFVLGDNRDNSADSRVYSFIPREEIIGRSSAVVFSLDSMNNYLPRGDRFFANFDNIN